MANNLRLTLLQQNLIWEDKNANLSSMGEAILQHEASADVYLLPEMFSTGFSMNPDKLAENSDGPTLKWMADLAAEKNALIAGSIIIQEKGNFFNRFYAVKPDGERIVYDKRHLFRMGDEESHYSRGEKRVVFEWKGWRILPVICYDIRFPVWMRNQDDYDLILVVANWPEPRRDVWINLLTARAIENQSCVAAVNRIGLDKNGVNHAGDSLVIDPKGQILADGKDQEGLILCEIQLDELLRFREKFPAYLDRDDFTILL